MISKFVRGTIIRGTGRSRISRAALETPAPPTKRAAVLSRRPRHNEEVCEAVHDKWIDGSLNCCLGVKMVKEGSDTCIFG